MEIVLLEQASKDRDYWKNTGNKVIMKRISVLLADIKAHPYTGIGKPEAFRNDLRGKWSRRINSEHRIIYTVREDVVYVFSMRYHYEKK